MIDRLEGWHGLWLGAGRGACSRRGPPTRGPASGESRVFDSAPGTTTLTSCPIEGGAFEVEWKCRLYADGAESGADRLACSAELHG